MITEEQLIEKAMSGLSNNVAYFIPNTKIHIWEGISSSQWFVENEETGLLLSGDGNWKHYLNNGIKSFNSLYEALQAYNNYLTKK